MLWFPSDQTSIEKQALEDASSKKFLEHVNWFYENTGYPKLLRGRTITTPGERIACDYIKRTLEGYGFDVQVQELTAYVQIPLEATLEVLEPEKKIIHCLTIAFTPGTTDEGIEGEVVYVKGGGYTDYVDVDAKGKIPLTELGMFPAMRHDKGAIAEGKGAIGFIEMNSTGPMDKRVFWRGGNKLVWGNPTPDKMDKFTEIPGVVVCRADGEYLKKLCAPGTVRLRLKAKTTPRRWTRIIQPVATLKGTEEPDKYVLLAGHYDVWTGGTLCNGGGNSIMLELGRILAKHKDRLRRGIKIAFWTGHEDYAMYTGSCWFVDNNWDDLKKNCVAYRVIDTQGMKGRYSYLCTYNEVRKFQNQVVKDVLNEEPIVMDHTASRKYGDQSLYGLGVTLFYERTSYDPGKTAVAAGDSGLLSSLGWQMHDPEDTPANVDMDSMYQELQTYLVSLLRMCRAPILPYEYVGVADSIKKILADLQERGNGILSLGKTIEKAETLRIKAEELEQEIQRVKSASEKPGQQDEVKKQLKILNDCLIRLTRTYSPIYYTKSGKYDQDFASSYGTESIPALQDVARLPQLLPATDEFETLITKLVRERNKVSDALDDMSETIDISLERVRNVNR